MLPCSADLSLKLQSLVKSVSVEATPLLKYYVKVTQLIPELQKILELLTDT